MAGVHHSSVHGHFVSKASLLDWQSPPSSSRMFGTRPYNGSNFWKYQNVLKKGVILSCLAERSYRKVPRRPEKQEERELGIDVKICLEEQLPDDSEILSIAEMLRLNAPMAIKLALDGLTTTVYKTRAGSIIDVGGYEKVELSLLLCNDRCIRKLNKEWRNEDGPTDVLSISQHTPEPNIPILMLGDIVVSVETAARQAGERGHTLLDEVRILMIHGLLHLLGFDHEMSEAAESEMEAEEDLLLKCLGWKGKGLIQCSHTVSADDESYSDRKHEGFLRFYKPKFKYIFCDMDGTLLNSKSQITEETAGALKEAMSRGVRFVIATGKTRAAVLSILKPADLVGKHSVVSECSPGVFLQGLLVYGEQGCEVFRGSLDRNICREAFLYSSEHGVPVVAYSADRCFVLHDHPLVTSLHTVYHEPKAEVIAAERLLDCGGDIQKLLFLDTDEGVSAALRPYWEAATRNRARVVQALPHMLEIVPLETSKGGGVRMLMRHLGIMSSEIMAIGDGENDVEMLEIASLGIALRNGSHAARAVADVIGSSNDEDGVADAIYRYAF